MLEFCMYQCDSQIMDSQILLSVPQMNEFDYIFSRHTSVHPYFAESLVYDCCLSTVQDLFLC